MEIGHHITANAVILALISATIWGYIGVKLYNAVKKRQREHQHQATQIIPLIRPASSIPKKSNASSNSLSSIPALTDTDWSSEEENENDIEASETATPNKITIEIVN